jgi:hypothetical protein
VIAELFDRPSLEVPLNHYTRDIVVDFPDTIPDQSFTPTAKAWFERLATGLYEHADDQVWARRSIAPEIDNVVLRLWDQQWPRLRRSFRFCTLTSRDRSQEGAYFDLQLSPGESSAQLRFSSNLEGFEATGLSNSEWLPILAHDAQYPQASTLRLFLKRLGADLQGGREAMRHFCNLHAALEESSSASLRTAVHLVEETAAFASSDAVKSLVLHSIVQHLLTIDDRTLLFVLENFHLLTDADVQEHQGNLAWKLWISSPRNFVAYGHDPREEVRKAVRAGASLLQPNELLSGLPEVSHLVEPFLEVVPGIAAEHVFWESTQVWPSTVAASGIDLANPRVLRAMIQGLRDDGAINSALHVVGARHVLECIESLSNEKITVPEIRQWIQHSCADTDAVAQFLARTSAPSQQLLILMAEVLLPDAVPNDQGEDPWCAALYALLRKEGGLPVQLCAFGFRRALGWRSKSVEALLMLTFEALHTSAVQQSIPEVSWYLVEGSLPWISSSHSWDYALRLRQVVARKCLDLRISPKSFAQFVSSDQLLVQLMDEICSLWNGTRYLKNVDEVLQTTSETSLSSRQKLISNYLKEHRKRW